LSFGQPLVAAGRTESCELVGRGWLRRGRRVHRGRRGRDWSQRQEPQELGLCWCIHGAHA